MDMVKVTIHVAIPATSIDDAILKAKKVAELIAQADMGEGQKPFILYNRAESVGQDSFSVDVMRD